MTMATLYLDIVFQKWIMSSFMKTMRFSLLFHQNMDVITVLFPIDYLYVINDQMLTINSNLVHDNAHLLVSESVTWCSLVNQQI